MVLRSTDLEVELEIKASAKVLEEGETCAPIYKLLEITNTITEPNISLNINETQRMKIITNRTLIMVCRIHMLTVNK